MDEPQEFKNLDELFRKTFDELPAAPAATGWDKPSDRVWEQVRATIKTPKSGWNPQSILLVASMAVVLMLGLYWAISQPGQEESPAPAIQPVTEQAEQPATAPDVATITTTGPSPESIAKSNGFIADEQTARPVTESAQAESLVPEERGQRILPPGSAPLPGTDPASPNTTVRRQLEAWRNAAWTQPLAP
ncbi:MAG: hypothetical protein EP344_06270, partial [Bacteroidetes bacterium]